MGDNDPARFWRHVVVEPDRVRPGIGERVGPLLGPPPSLCEVLLVLDDYHLIDVEPVHTTVHCLLESARRAPVAEQPASTRRCRWRGCGSAPSCTGQFNITAVADHDACPGLDAFTAAQDELQALATVIQPAPGHHQKR